MFNLSCPYIDKLSIIIDNVDEVKFDYFMGWLELFDIKMNSFWIGDKIHEYYKNFTINDREKSVYIGWRHNSHRKKNDLANKLKVEFNPSKCSPENRIFDAISKVFQQHNKTVVLMDLAWDIPIYKESIIITSKTGKEENRIQGTSYWGKRGQNGNMKKYDKKKEREEINDEYIDEPYLTRIEYSFKPKEGIPFDFIEEINITPSKLYNVSLINLNFNLDYSSNKQLRIICMVYCISIGLCQLKNFSRTDQNHIKNALDGYQKLPLDESINENIKTISETIKSYFAQHITNMHGKGIRS